MLQWLTLQKPYTNPCKHSRPFYKHKVTPGAIWKSQYANPTQDNNQIISHDTYTHTYTNLRVNFVCVLFGCQRASAE